MTQTDLLRQGVQDDGYTTRNHRLFVRLQSHSDQSRFYTTDEVLTEFLTFYPIFPKHFFHKFLCINIL